MTPVDLPEVAKLDRLAFSYARSTLRIPTEMIWLYSQFPEANLVAESGDRIVGYLFGHRWGALHWCGPLGVQPDSQGNGIGKELMRHWLDRTKGVSMLETRPERDENVAFYLGLGMRLGGLRATFTGAIEPSAGHDVFETPFPLGPFMASAGSWCVGDDAGGYAFGIGPAKWFWRPRPGHEGSLLGAIAARVQVANLMVPVDLEDMRLVARLFGLGFRLSRPMQRFLIGPLGTEYWHARLMA